ncbi:MAG TPA: sigma 54-interacting transcriptional regulator, partial [Labilithrix sp.]|nr:sigma 54-interacting transcriptional regulator [Labilithrix sp.]
MIRVEVTRGESAGASLEPTTDVIRIGRAEGNDLVVPDTHVSSEHAKIVFAGERYVLVDQRSTNGTAILRRGERIALDDVQGREAPLEDADVIELGSADRIVQLTVTLRDDVDDARVFALKKIEDLVGPQAMIVEKDDNRLRALYDAQKKIGSAPDLAEVLVAICEASFTLVPLATHVTIVLRDDDEEGAKPAGAAGYVPVMTRVRGQAAPSSSPIPITRSVFRKVVTERAAVVAADAPSEVGNSESLMGAQIRSTLGIPLWRGEDILGVIQVDNREAGVLTSGDLEIMAVLAHNASLAVANARLVKRLRAAEERLKKENAFLKNKEQERRGGNRAGGGPEIIGSSAPMKALLQQLEKVVNTRVTVLIEGETGVGKELIAASVHYRSNRRDRLFVGQNCAAMPETLLESELFGHRKGSFTGAHEDKKGLFEIADGGTLFLD